jgi:5-methylthioribose kinase
MSAQAEFQQSHPDVFFLDARDLDALTRYLRTRAWIEPQERVLSAASAGEGNMNCTLRIRTSQRSFILKQARPWVEKYPHIAAPWDRALIEAELYKTIQSDSRIRSYTPELMDFDPDSKLLMLQDCGDSPDFTHIYHDQAIDAAEVAWLADFLVTLHSRFRDPSLMSTFRNIEMRQLNHEHLFEFPLRPNNGLTLDAITPGLADSARSLQEDLPYRNRVANLGELYLSAGECLIHGDYFPGSWLRSSQGIKVIDLEFGFFGLPELDLGMMSAHFHLALCPGSVVENALAAYRAARPLDLDLVRGFAGVEMMRRLIGVSQLPLRYGLEEKQRLLDVSRQMVKGL